MAYESDIYIIAYVDDLLITGPDQESIQYMVDLIKGELLLKDVGWLTAGQEVRFLGRRLRHRGISISVWVDSSYIDNMIESMEPDPHFMTTPNYYGHMQLTKLVNLVGNLRDWH